MKQVSSSHLSPMSATAVAWAACPPCLSFPLHFSLAEVTFASWTAASGKSRNRGTITTGDFTFVTEKLHLSLTYKKINSTPSL